MGYAHGTKWTDEKIENEIYNVINVLNIDRMPTKTEIGIVTKNHGLNNKISRSGGYKYWANKLGLDIKDSETRLGQEWEVYTKNIIESRGYYVEKMTTRHPYDLLINNNIKVDVKVSNYYHGKGFKYHTFNLENKYHNCDIFICIGLDELGQVVKCLVIPSKYLMNKKQLSIGIHSRYDKFNNAWSYIEKYSEFYSVMI